MQVVRTVVPGALLLDPAGTDLPPVRGRQRSVRGEVHGLHGHRTASVVVDVPRGTGYAVVIDARPSAETFGRLAVTMLDGDRALLVPPGCLYGVQAVDDRTLVVTRSRTRLVRRDRLAADPGDPDLKIRWLRPLPAREPDRHRSWAGLCDRLGAPAGPRRDRVMLW